MEIYLEGFITKKIYQNGDFKIYGFVPTDEYSDKVIFNSYNNISIQGEIPDLYEKILYKINVEYKKKGKYDNYIVKKIHRDIKNIDEESTIKFLKAINITSRQIGELMKYYPDIINRVLENKEINVDKLYGIKYKTLEVIKRKIIENFKLMELVTEFYEYNMTFSMIKKLYELYPSIEGVRKAMSKDPYDCLCKINGVGFKKADEVILKKYPEKVESKQRAKACLYYLLKDNETKGHSYIDLLKLYKKFKDLATECSKWFNDVIKNDKDIYVDSDGKKIALKNSYICEYRISKMIDILLHNNKELNISYEKYNEIDGVPLTEEQINALKNICQYNISILAGFGGTGKSFCTKAIINMLEDNNLSSILMSPTGKASKTLSKYSGKKASTIHRGLGYKDGKFIHNEENKLPYDVIIVDEFSMIDIYLLESLLKAVDLYKTKILFIGDPAQIPSVGVGNIAHDMIHCSKIPITILTNVFRYGEGGLSYVTTETRYGEFYLKGNKNIEVFGKNKDYVYINIVQEQMIDCIKQIYNKLHFNKKISIDDIMVLSAYNKGNYGTYRINSIIQELVNPKTNDKEEVKYKNDKEFIILREGDKVMQVRNNYDVVGYDEELDIQYNAPFVFNGDIGTIKYIKDDCLYVEMDDNIIVYEKEEYKQLTLAYAMSIHKSQGSEAKYVIIITPKAHKFFLDRNLLYVGNTRGKIRVYHLGTYDVVKSSLVKSQNFNRKTFLKELLDK